MWSESRSSARWSTGDSSATAQSATPPKKAHCWKRVTTSPRARAMRTART
jgi:hypothetical protein